MSEENQVVDALVESNDLLQEEVTRLRETNAMLRRVNRALRRTLDSLRNQVAAAAENDETFKAFCAGEFDDQVIETEDAGLAESVSQVEARG
jgi:prefoldin subunit 5